MKKYRLLIDDAKIKSDLHGPSKTIKEQGGKWWWADEVWEWHGPCFSRESAQKRQSLYASNLMGEVNIVTTKDWELRKDREPEDKIHPYNKAEPWDCACAGACSCHWETDPKNPYRH